MSSGSRKKRQSVNQTAGGIMFGLEPQLLRATTPAEELVHPALPDVAVPAADGELLTLELPEQADLDDPWAGIEEELVDDDPWAEYAAEAPADPSSTANVPGADTAPRAKADPRR